MIQIWIAYPIHDNAKMRYHGCIIPGPLPDAYSYSTRPKTLADLNRLTRAQQLEVTRADAQTLVDKINAYARSGRPVPFTTEHMISETSPDGKPLKTGSVTRAWFAPDGSVHAEFELDTTSEDSAGPQAQALLDNGYFKGLSLRHTMNDMEPQEISLCIKGARAGTGVTGKVLDHAPTEPNAHESNSAQYMTAPSAPLSVAASTMSTASAAHAAVGAPSGAQPPPNPNDHFQQLVMQHLQQAQQAQQAQQTPPPPSQGLTLNSASPLPHTGAPSAHQTAATNSTGASPATDTAQDREVLVAGMESLAQGKILTKEQSMALLKRMQMSTDLETEVAKSREESARRTANKIQHFQGAVLALAKSLMKPDDYNSREDEMKARIGTSLARGDAEGLINVLQPLTVAASDLLGSAHQQVQAQAAAAAEVAASSAASMERVPVYTKPSFTPTAYNPTLIARSDPEMAAMVAAISNRLRAPPATMTQAPALPYTAPPPAAPALPQYGHAYAQQYAYPQHQPHQMHAQQLQVAASAGGGPLMHSQSYSTPSVIPKSRNLDPSLFGEFAGKDFSGTHFDATKLYSSKAITDIEGLDASLGVTMESRTGGAKRARV